MYFTASATMAANVILQGFPWKAGDVVVVSPYEHNAVMRTLHAMEKRHGIQTKVLPVRADGQIDPEKTAVLLAREKPRPCLRDTGKQCDRLPAPLCGDFP